MTPEQIARDVAETATLSDTQNPETGAYEPVIEDLGQLASFIEDGIRADRAQRIPATSASDRHEAAAKALSDFRARTTALGTSVETPFERTLADALGALIEYPPVAETIDDQVKLWEHRLWMEGTADILGGFPMQKQGDGGRPWYELYGEAYRQGAFYGVTAAWADWEPENAPGMVDTRATDVIDIVFDRLPDHDGANFIETEDKHGHGVKVGEWVTRPDGHAALRIEVVR